MWSESFIVASFEFAMAIWILQPFESLPSYRIADRRNCNRRTVVLIQSRWHGRPLPWWFAMLNFEDPKTRWIDLRLQTETLKNMNCGPWQCCFWTHRELNLNPLLANWILESQKEKEIVYFLLPQSWNSERGGARKLDFKTIYRYLSTGHNSWLSLGFEIN